jgi:hypothetical protein
MSFMSFHQFKRRTTKKTHRHLISSHSQFKRTLRSKVNTDKFFSKTRNFTNIRTSVPHNYFTKLLLSFTNNSYSLSVTAPCYIFNTPRKHFIKTYLLIKLFWMCIPNNYITTLISWTNPISPWRKTSHCCIIFMVLTYSAILKILQVSQYHHRLNTIS